MFHKITTWFESHMGTCSFHEHTGIACPGCGIQRSVLAMLRGDFMESILLFPALLPLMVMLVFLGFHLAFDLKNGALILKILYITNSFLIIGPFLFKFIFH